MDIVLCVLSAVNDGLDKPTRIMYSANLSWKPTKRILASLVEQGLLRESGETGSKRSKKRYDITDKGLNVLEYFEGASGLLEIAEFLTTD